MSKKDWGSLNEAPDLRGEGVPRWLPPTLLSSPRVYDSEQLETDTPSSSTRKQTRT